MPALKPYFVQLAVERLQPHLNPAPREALQKLVSVLQPDGFAKVTEVHAALFPLNDTAGANKALTRLIDAVSEAEKSTGIWLKLKITKAKKGARQVWFEGPLTGPAEPNTPDLNAVPPEQLMPQRGFDPDFGKSVVLLTFNVHETAGVF